MRISLTLKTQGTTQIGATRISTEVPGLERKEGETPHALKVLALEMIDEQHHPSVQMESLRTQ